MLGRWLAAGSAVVAGVASVSGLCARHTPCHALSAKNAACPLSVPSESGVTKAKRGISAFLRDLRSPKPTQEYFSVAVPGRAVGDDRKTVWVDGLCCNGKTLEGRLVGRANRSVHFPIEQVSDWMVVDSGRVSGGFSLRN